MGQPAADPWAIFVDFTTRRTGFMNKNFSYKETINE
jgi:hypothetical protein